MYSLFPKKRLSSCFGVFLLSFANLAADTENAGPAQQREPKLHPGFKLFGVFFLRILLFSVLGLHPCAVLTGIAGSLA